MKEKPILFSTPMIQAILDGRKTQTRRIIKDQPLPESKIGEFIIEFTKQWKRYDLIQKIQISSNPIGYEAVKSWKCPFGKIGDILWVKEMYYAYGMWIKNGHTKGGKQKWKFFDTTLTGYEYHYQDNPPENILPNTKHETYGWFKRLSLFMPKEACRIRLKITNIRVERLQDITEQDAIVEGIESRDGIYKDYLSGEYYRKPLQSYLTLWESINGKGSWDKNPWVWVIEFNKL
jgi:hypothetical protein